MAQESQNIESIFDFFYLDNPKIKSFYAQLNGLGALNTLKNTSQIGDIRKMEATVGLPTVTGGKLGNDHSVSSTAEHLYDGLPTMPREMIDRLDELGFIRKELKADLLGNLVLLKGRLGVFDIGVSKELMEPAINMHIKTLESDHRTKKEAAELKKNKQDLLNFCKSIPYGLEAKVLVKTGEKSETGVELADEVWMTLNRAEMSGSTHDINFKHGEFLAGDWHVLGVLDALPYDDFTFDTEKNDFRHGVSALIQLMKDFAGRPSTAFGLTPIAIFRVLKPASK